MNQESSIRRSVKPSKGCPFCEILAGTRAALLIAEAPAVVAFLDHHPYSRGHALVVPRRHYRDLLAVPPRVVGEMFRLARRLGAAAVSPGGLAAHGFHLGVNTGAAARQVVFHAHVHVIPRWHGDGMDFATRLRLSPRAQTTAAEAYRRGLAT